MFLNDDDMVECPYNSTHRMLRRRLQSHLIKCRVHYPEVELKKCPFNITHLVPEPEYAHHAKNCPDRNLITQYKYDAPEQKEEELPKHAPIECEENWDDTEVKDYNPRLNLERASVLLRPVGLNPSERKLFIKKERKRLGDDEGSSDDGSKNEATSSKGKRKKYDYYGDDFYTRAVSLEHDGRSLSPCSSSLSTQSSRSPSTRVRSRNLLHSPTGWERSREYLPQRRTYPSYTDNDYLSSLSHFAEEQYYRKRGRTPNNDQYNSGRDDYYSNYSYQPYYDRYYERNDMMPQAPPPPIISYPTRHETYSSKNPYP